MDQLAAALPGLTLFAIMFALGLGLQPQALEQIRRRPALVLRVLIGSCVLVPLVVDLFRATFAIQGWDIGPRAGWRGLSCPSTGWPMSCSSCSW